MLFLRFFFSPDLFVYLFLWNGKASGYRRFSSFPLFVSLFLCSSCNITLIISTVKRRVLIILWRFCERYEPCKMVKKDALLVYLQRRLFLLFYRATALQRGNSFPSCAWRNILFRTRFSWFDHIFTTNSWKNIFVWFSYHILRQRLMVYTTAGTVSGRFILDISFSTWDFSAIWL